MSEIATIRLALALSIVSSFALAMLLTPVSMRLAKTIGIMDVPRDERRMHKDAMPMMGGFAIFVTFTVVAFAGDEIFFSKYNWLSLLPDKIMAVLISGAAIFVLGVIDDIFDIKAWVKLIGQIACASLAFFLGIRMPAISFFGWQFGDSFAGLLTSFILTVLWLVAITNTINLIDGLDGLAGGVAAIASLGIGYSAYIHGLYTVAFLMVILAGSSLGFLRYNFFPAKTFMGDSGAMFLGFTIASISIVGPAKGATVLAMLGPVLVLGVPIFDVLFAIFRRFISKQPIFTADTGHIHHQLTKLGMGQRRTVLMIYGISAVMAVAAVDFSRNLFLEAGSLFLAALLFIIVLIWGWNKE
ncbi:MAG: undecaprenyl/decaprenyl-phosphate alpha-N-acetylglucosaminyl 1-phosphate transferase [Clostridiales Family XIII bacterium]|jgi:UDP-GlcNAc:undecaprenyl-phosphate GlcNAc-1-phosphate transferase|nr:undecaprenyl/decaprenyl-phosphate alpha-N-acetylglucosaminyl 1-phosphate transferase [Clostridiales Family XIII bacterium]